MTDPIADLLTRLRNAQAVNKKEIILPHSKFKFELLKILKKEKYIGEIEEAKNKFKELKVKLKYENNKPQINSIKRISKPGRKVYCDKNNLPIVLNNFGLAVISTNKGLMTNKEAKKQGLGGEVVCEIY